MFVRLFVRCVVRKKGMSSIFQEVRKVRQKSGSLVVLGSRYNSPK